MRGNLYGWIIAGVLAVVMAFGLQQIASVNRVTEATAAGIDPKYLASISFDGAANKIVPMTTPADVAAFYLQVVADVNENPNRYKSYLNDGTIAGAKSLKSFQLLEQAERLQKTTFLAANPEKNIGYFENATSSDLSAIDIAGQAVERLGMLHFKARDFNAARKQFEIEFALGAHLFDERVCFKEAEKGISFMSAALQMLLTIARSENATQRISDLEEFNAKLMDTFKHMREMWSVIYAVDERVVATHAGDIFAFASPAMNERMWRVEAILKLGRFKYNYGGSEGRPTDKINAAKRLDEIEKNETDPIIRAAVKAAKSLSQEQFRDIH